MTPDELRSHWKLTEREFEILQLAAQGHSTNEIAMRLFIAINTVNKHSATLRLKMGVQTTAEAKKAFIEKLS